MAELYVIMSALTVNSIGQNIFLPSCLSLKSKKMKFADRGGQSRGTPRLIHQPGNLPFRYSIQVLVNWKVWYSVTLEVHLYWCFVSLKSVNYPDVPRKVQIIYDFIYQERLNRGESTYFHVTFLTVNDLGHEVTVHYVHGILLPTSSTLFIVMLLREKACPRVMTNISIRTE